MFNQDSDKTGSSNGGIYGKFRERLRNIKLARIRKQQKSKTTDLDEVKKTNTNSDVTVVVEEVVKEIRATAGDRNYGRRAVGISIEDTEVISFSQNKGVVKKASEEVSKASDISNDKGLDDENRLDDIVTNIRANKPKVRRTKKARYVSREAKRDLSCVSKEERKELLEALGAEIIEKIKGGFEDKLDELEVLESELWLLNQQHDSELELEKVREIKKKINDLIDKINEIIVQYNLYAKSYYMDNVIGLDDNVLLDDIIDYRTLLDSFEGEKDFINEVQALDEFRSLYDNLVEIKGETEKLQEANEEKIEEYDIRDKKYDSIKLDLIAALDVGKRTDLEVDRQNEYIKRLMEDIDNIDRHEYVTSHLRGFGALLSSGFRYMRALMMSPLSGMLPGIGMQALVARRMIANAYRNLHYEEVNHIYYEAINYDSELNHHLTDVKYVEDMVDGALKDVGRLRDEFMKIYDRNIPGYEDTLKKMAEIEKNLVRSQNRVFLVRKNLKRSKKINENKMMRVRQLNENAKKEAA